MIQGLLDLVTLSIAIDARPKFRVKLHTVLPEMATGRQSGDFWSFLSDKSFEIYLLNGDFSQKNVLSDGNFSANLS